ncbi:TrkH family potassium uptake protein [symbiont of Argiope bruennichi]|uniref:TrkH family potassium uptake protein n=1 Tax=symbiont of Argiope bruennichi TaxID=2810479 RepID=UPI003DA6ADAB
MFDKKLKFQNNLKKIINIFSGFKKSYKLKFFIYYLLILLFLAWVLTTNLSLKTDISQNPLNTNGKEKFSFIDALFTAGSAFSDTGLTVISIFDQFNLFGQIIVLFLIQLGGIGLTVLKYIFIRAIGKKIGFTDSLAFNDERGYSKLGSSESIIITTIILIFGLQFISSITLMFHFHYYHPDTATNLNVNNSTDFKNFNNLIGQLNNNYFLSFWYGWFHSTSAINNAGFDIFGNNSLIYFSTDYFFQFIMLFLLMVGGIGFPVYFEIWQKIKYKFVYKKSYRYSLLFKFSVISYFFITFFSILLVFMFESLSHSPNGVDNIVNNSTYSFQSNNKAPALFSDSNYSWTQKVFFVIFNTQSTRNAGFATLPMQQFSSYTKIIFSLLMWVGASPCSTGGGIRGTTLFIVVLALWKKIKGEKQINIFKKRISLNLVSSAFIVFFASCVLLLISTMICNTSLYETKYISIKDYGVLDSFFTICSGFGTTGLSTGFTYYLNTASKIITIIVMFIGQLTISNTLILTTSKKFTERKRKINYAKEDILIG